MGFYDGVGSSHVLFDLIVVLVGKLEGGKF